MESTSEAMKIQISEFTKDRLPPEYLTEERSVIKIKGKGESSGVYRVGGDRAITPLLFWSIFVKKYSENLAKLDNLSSWHPPHMA